MLSHAAQCYFLWLSSKGDRKSMLLLLTRTRSAPVIHSHNKANTGRGMEGWREGEKVQDGAGIICSMPVKWILLFIPDSPSSQSLFIWFFFFFPPWIIPVFDVARRGEKKKKKWEWKPADPGSHFHTRRYNMNIVCVCPTVCVCVCVRQRLGQMWWTDVRLTGHRCSVKNNMSGNVCRGRIRIIL